MREALAPPQLKGGGGRPSRRSDTETSRLLSRHTCLLLHSLLHPFLFIRLSNGPVAMAADADTRIKPLIPHESSQTALTRVLGELEENVPKL